MTPLRQRMIEDLQLKGYSGSTQKLYVNAVRQLCDHFSTPPGKITEDNLREYFLYGKNVKKWSRSTSTVALCGIKFFYENTIKRPWPTLLFIRPGHEKKLPVVLSRDEVHKLLHSIRLLRYRVCLATIYSCGLRLSEGTHLKVEDIDADRGFISVRQSKGNKDRNVPLPKTTLLLLRQQWKQHRNEIWIFPAAGRGGVNFTEATTPMSNSSVQIAFRKAVKTAGIHVHFIVPGGGLSPDRSQWLPSSTEFFVPVEALSPIFHAKFRDAMKKTKLFGAVPAGVWKKQWVVHCKPVGNGNRALKYLAPYIYRVAITNNRIEKLENEQVTFHFKNSSTDQWEAKTLPVFDFMHRFLQHVLPKGLVKFAIMD